MARPRNIVPTFICIDCSRMDVIQASFRSDAEFGEWCRKAIRDIRSGCKSEDVDPIVMEVYQKSMKKMENRQNTNHNHYKSSKKLKSAGASHRKAEDELRKEPEGATMEYTQPHAPTQHSGSANLESGTPADLTLLPPDEKSCYGEFQHVMLTNGEGQKLRELYGDNLKLAIDILDSWIHNNARKASKYKSHYAVMRKSGWVWDEVQKRIIRDNQVTKSAMQPKSFQQQERERSARGAEYLLSMQGAV